MKKEIMDKVYIVGNIYSATHDNIVAVNRETEEIYFLQKPFIKEKGGLVLKPANKAIVYHITTVCEKPENVEGPMIGTYEEIFKEKGEWYIAYFLEGKLKELKPVMNDQVYETAVGFVKNHWGGMW